MTRTTAAAPRTLPTSRGARFIAVGAVNTAFAFLLFAGLETLLGDHLGYIVVLLITHMVCVLEAYVLQRWLVFHDHTRSWIAGLWRFWVVYLAALAANLVALPLLVEVANVDVLPAQALIVVATAATTFLVHRSFTFATHPDRQGQR